MAGNNPRGSWEIPSLFRNMKAVLADPASGRVDRLKPLGDVAEQATKSSHEFAPDVRVDRQPFEDRRGVERC